MEWQVAIDVEWWKNEDSLLLDGLLSYAKNKKSWLSVLVPEEIYTMIPQDRVTILYTNLSQVSKQPYFNKPDEMEITLSPDLTAGLDHIEKSVTEDAAYTFCQTAEPPHKIYALTPERNKDNIGILRIQCNSSKNVALLTITNEDSLRLFLRANEPKLVQVKHIAQQERYIGGEIVSKFSAWDPWHPEYAESLLKKAFDESGSELLPPEELFVWDSQNETYVRFMHSGKWEYHGHDFDEYERIPDIVKTRYNHWKK